MALNLSCCVQPSLDGLEQAFILGRPFVGGRPSALVLGDSLFYGHEFQTLLRTAAERACGATVLAHHVHYPQRYGVVQFDTRKRAPSIEKRSAVPKSNYAVTELYFYDDQVCSIAASVRPSARGDLEITEVNARYLRLQQLEVEIMGHGNAWMDTCTHGSMLEASQFIATLEERQGLKVACPEKIAFRAGWIMREQLEALAWPMLRNGYCQCMMQLAGKQAF